MLLKVTFDLHLSTGLIARTIRGVMEDWNFKSNSQTSGERERADD